MRLIALGLLLPSLALATDFAVVNATVHTLQPGAPPLTDGVVVVRGGKVACVGVRKAQAGHALLGHVCALPTDVTVLDVAGGVVTPGLIESFGRVGQIEVDAEDSSHDGVARKESNLAQIRAIDGIRLQSRATEAARKGGIALVVAKPLGGALVAGQSVAFRTAGQVVDDAVVKTPVAVHATFGDEAKADEAYVGSRSGQLALLRTLLGKAKRVADVQAGKKPKDAAEKEALQKLLDDPSLLVLAQVVAGKLPLVVHVHRADDIASLLRLKTELPFELVIAGGAEAHVVADRLAAAKVPVIVGPVRVTPYTFATARAEVANAAKLHAAGVTLALATGGNHDVRNLRWEAGIAVQAGLPWSVALAAVTRMPSEILHLGPSIGTLAEGGPADLVLFDGDPLSLEGHVRAVSVGGQLEREPRQR